MVNEASISPIMAFLGSCGGLMSDAGPVGLLYGTLMGTVALISPIRTLKGAWR